MVNHDSRCSGRRIQYCSLVRRKICGALETLLATACLHVDPELSPCLPGCRPTRLLPTFAASKLDWRDSRRYSVEPDGWAKDSLYKSMASRDWLVVADG